MALAPRLEIRTSQQLVMTPQLQQAIKLLQLSNLELTEFVEQQLEENPFLERAQEAHDAAQDSGQEAHQNAEKEAPADDAALDLTKQENLAKAEASLDRDYDDNSSAPTESDSAGGEYQTNDWAGLGNRSNSFEDNREIGDQHTNEISLREHLSQQLTVSTSDSQTLFIGSYLIDLIDDAGYLREDDDTLAERLGADAADVRACLELIQSFDPIGVGARSLQECLRLQLKELDRLDPTMELFIESLDLLAKGDLKGLIKATRADEEDVRDMIAEVRNLNPKPGYAYGAETVQIVEPDVFVKRAADGGWKIELNNDTLPKVLVNQRYYTEISGSKQKESDASFLHEQFSNASWLAKSLDQRARTILKVAGEIVRQQDGFLAYGVKHLRPLNLKAVADAIEMHESTVSRVTSNKYIATPRGIFELKYFFTASIGSTEGGDLHSAEAVRHRIKELIEAEAADAVLSDDKIVEILRAESVDIARRTVAKYRETMGIPSSVQRRRAAVRNAI